jgi:DNA-binding protein H-NS
MSAKRPPSEPGKTYAELLAQINDLQQQAEMARQRELSTVIATIKEQIAAHGLTAADLGLSPRATRGRRQVETAPAFADGEGNTWVGRGKRPEWVRAALASGKSLNDLRVR